MGGFDGLDNAVAHVAHRADPDARVSAFHLRDMLRTGTFIRDVASLPGLWRSLEGATRHKRRCASRRLTDIPETHGAMLPSHNRTAMVHTDDLRSAMAH